MKDMQHFPKKIDTGLWDAGHIQGIAVDEEKGYIYYSYTTIFVKAKLDGTVVGYVAASCERNGYTGDTVCQCGVKVAAGQVISAVGHKYDDQWDTACNHCGVTRTIESTPMYRLYNATSGEHFYTGSIRERDDLVQAGWHYEGIAWSAPVTMGDPVYRLYNPNSGDHHYTMSATERDNVVAAGWIYEGVAWNSASASGVPIYRMYNPNAVTGIHHYTGSMEEVQHLESLGWIYEGIGWYSLGG